MRLEMKSRGWKLMLAALLALSLTLAAAASAAAATPALLYQTPIDGLAGSDAGHLREPRGVAADPDTGHVYVADSGNNRVAEFGPWGEFLKAWGWGVSNGQAELQTCGPAATPPTVTCHIGISGAGVGQFDHTVGGIAVDANGDVWVADLANHRIEKFSPSGDFLLMVGGQVDKGPNNPGNLCTAAFITSGDTCGAGVAGGGSSEFESSVTVGTALAVGGPGTVFLGDKGRLEEFSLGGAFLSQTTLEAPHSSDFIHGIDRNADGSFYLLLGPEGGNYPEKAVRKVNAAGAVVASISLARKPTALTVDADGNLFVAIREIGEPAREDVEVIEFGPSGEPLLPIGQGFAASPSVPSGTHVIFGLGSNVVTAGGESDVYITELGAPEGKVVAAASLSSYGPPPDKWLPPAVAPEIVAQYATSVAEDSALVRAEINPLFWDDTTYSLEYGTGKCSEGGCPNTTPVPPAKLGGGLTNKPVRTAAITLAGLSPNTTYHFRFVAQSGGGPTVGVGAEEAEATFTTPVAPQRNGDCPNQAFRIGPSAALPDCRAYEMVSPVEKNNTDIVSLININSNLAMLDQSATSGERLAYTTSQGFGDAQGTPYVSQYMATRHEGQGWSNHGITPPQGLSPLAIGKRLDIEFRAFTDDLCGSVLQHVTDPALAPGAIEGFANLYTRQNCGTEGYEALTTSEPPNLDPPNYVPEVQGLSAAGRCAVFYAVDQLTPDASPLAGGHNRQVYESCGGELHLISVLPSGAAATAASTGTANQGAVDFRTANDLGAVSADGSRVYWTEAFEGPGRLYLRINAQQEQSAISSGQCTEEEKACTIKVSQTVSGAEAHFWGASADGSKAIFSIEDRLGNPLDGNLYEFSLESGKSTLIAKDVMGVMGVGGEASRAYFVSKAALAPGGEAGKPNLYFYEAAGEAQSFQFIGVLSQRDSNSNTNDLTPVNRMPYKKTSRLSPDGRHLAFTSTASLTGYDNTDQASGEPDAEVYVHDSETEELHCASCNPTGQRPTGRKVVIEANPAGNWAAALLPTYTTELYGTRVISEDGSRVFFNSYDALLPGDTNGVADVYEWEAPGSGDCTAESRSFHAANGGCLSLISTGESPSDSLFVDASADGRDVFFTTASSLIPQDPGLIDIYDAREGGGLPAPAGRAPACEGEACQGPLAPPNDPTPASSSFEGAGNVVEKPARKAHKKSARKKKKRGKHQRKTARPHKQAKHSRKAAR